MSLETLFVILMALGKLRKVDMMTWLWLLCMVIMFLIMISAEQYFEIIEKDDTGRPKIIEPMDFGLSLFEDPTSIYTDNEGMTGGSPDLNPVYWGMSNG